MKRLSILTLLTAVLLMVACASPAAPTQAGEPTQATALVDGAYPAASTPVDSYPAPGIADPGMIGAYPPPYEAGKTSGVAAVDKVLAVLPSSNSADVQNLLVFASVACTTGDGLGGPPKCKDGESDGAQVEALPVLSSEGTWQRKGEVPADFLMGPLNLLGVYEVNPDAANDPNFPAGKYAVLVTQAAQPNSLILLRVDDAGIVRVDYRMTGISDGFQDAKQFILPLQQ